MSGSKLNLPLPIERLNKIAGSFNENVGISEIPLFVRMIEPEKWLRGFVLSAFCDKDERAFTEKVKANKILIRCI